MPKTRKNAKRKRSDAPAMSTTSRSSPRFSEELSEQAPDPVSDVLVSKEYREIRKRDWQRWRDLAANKQFVWETFKLKYQLGSLLKEDPKRLEQFFTPSFPVNVSSLRAVDSKINAISDERWSRVLNRYTRYAVLYEVMFLLQRKRPRFRVAGNGFRGSKFDVTFRDGRLEPIGGASGEEPLLDGYGYESDNVPVPASIEELIKRRRARYVRVQDFTGDSVLTELLNFSYSPTEITVIDIAAPTQTRRFFMVGENVALNSVFQELRRAITESQTQSGGSEQRGRSADVASLYGRLSAIVRLTTTMQEKAADMVANDDKGRIFRGETLDNRSQSNRIAVLQSYLTQLRNQLEG